MMILQTLAFQTDVVISLCAVCVNDNIGGKTALLIIVLSLIILGLINWAWKKYLVNKKEVSQQK